MLGGEERKKEQNAKLNRGRYRFIYIKDLLHSKKSKQRNKCRKNNIGLKIKIKKRGKKKEEEEENNTELQKPNVEAEVYDNNEKCD